MTKAKAATKTATKTEVETPPEGPTAETGRLPAVAPAPLATGAKLAPIVPSNLDEQWRVAGIIQAAKMAPKSYENDRNKIMVGIMAGAEIGLPPMVAIQSIAVINNVPCLWGDGLLGVVRASRLLEDIEEFFSFEGDTCLAATCIIKRKGDARPIERIFTRAQAVKANLAKKAGTWQEYPDRMLQMRARGFALRDGFADILKGLGSAEEAVDGGHLVEQEDGTYAAPARPKRSEYETEARARAEAAGIEVDADDNAEVETEVVDMRTVADDMDRDGDASAGGSTKPAKAPAKAAKPDKAALDRADAAARGWAFIDLQGGEHVFDTAGEAATAFEHAINATETKDQAATLWADNQTFRDAVKEADSKRYLGMRQFYSDMSGAVA